MTATIKRNSRDRQPGNMLAVDLRRMFTSRYFYVLLGVALVIPVLILVMTTMMDSGVSVDPSTGAETAAEAFENVWQAIGTLPGAATGGGMSMTSMCNINLVYFLAAILVGIFVCDDFRSGYCKNLFAVRSKKAGYVASKTIASFVGGGLMLICFFIGAIIGGAISGLPFEMSGFNIGNLILCMISKILLMAVFAGIYVLTGVIGKQRLWLAVLLSLGVGMFLFNIIPTVTPLDATFMNVILCLVGGVLLGGGLGVVSRAVLDHFDIL